ncbi:MAG: mechanosensitive ion channel [Desulfovibrio sp.]|nr:mechanosensitive ion channel [Desulfovibrio sp.]
MSIIGARSVRALPFLFFLVLCSLPCLAASDLEESHERGEAAEEAEKTGPTQDQAWEAIWSGQRERVNEMRETALRMSDSFAEQAQTLDKRLQPFREESRRLLVFAQTFSNYPNPLEAVARRMAATIQNLDLVLEPVTLARSEAEGLLEQVNQIAASLPEEVDRSTLSREMRAFISDINQTRLRLTAVLAQYNSLLPSLGLEKKLSAARADINARLPGLWKEYYLQRPVPWLSPDSWIHLGRDVSYSLQSLVLRLPVELPGSAPQWGTAILRFFIGLFFAGALSLILRSKLLDKDSPVAEKHIFSIAMPWLVLGFALLGSALSSTGEFFRLFLAVGSACVLVGQVYLAWDLRRLQYPTLTRPRPPFLRLLPLAFIAYALLYLPLTAALGLVLWSAIIVCALFLQRRRKKRDYGPASLETGVLDCDAIVIWICLFLALSGLHIYSMALYIAYVSLSVALELSVAGMTVVSSFNEHLPQEGARAVLARLLVALAAPFVLILAVAGVCLWVAMLPGGTYLLSEYALKGVSVGATQFNIIQILLIISAFYLTRTVVSMGTRLLARLPQQGIHFDVTLITPLQTFLTYAAWALFGLFVLHALGMSLRNLAVIAGGLSVGIGFGMQTIVNNFFSGLILIFGRTLQVGDVVEVGGLTGRVRKVSIRATMIETYDNAVIYVPNSEFMSGRLINWTSFSRSVRKQVNVGVAYGSDTEKVIKLLISTAKDHENVLKYPVPSVIFADFGASTLDFQLRFWVKDYELGARTMSDIRLAINKVFAQENIEIAFPQLDVHLKDMPEDTERPEQGTPGDTAAETPEKSAPQAGEAGGPGPEPAV